MVSAPETLEGAQIWDLVLRLGGQQRVAVIGERHLFLGWDMGAALAMGAALGIAPLLLVEVLPLIEAIAVEKMNAD